MEIFGQLKKLDANDNATENDQSMFVLTILEKIKETGIKLSQGSITVSQKMANYQKARVKITNAKLTNEYLQQNIMQQQN